MLDKIFSIAGLIIGISAIIFRKRYARYLIREQLKKAKPKQKAYWDDFKEKGFDNMFYVIYEIVAIIAGVFFIIISILKLKGR